MTADLMILFHTSTIGNYIIIIIKLWVIQVHNGVTHANPHDLLRKEKKVKINKVKRRKLLHNLLITNNQLITNVSTGRAATCRVGISGQPSDRLKKLLLYIKQNMKEAVKCCRTE